jgi:sec-independent protein translocase protein TatC
MVYLKELQLRIVFSFIAVFSCLFCLFLFRQDLIFIYIIPSFSTRVPIEYFIFTEPMEIFSFYIGSFIIFGLFFLMPYFFWQIIDFLKGALFQKEWIRLKKFLISYIIFFLFSFSFIFLALMPLLWDFFSSFHLMEGKLPFYLELKASQYFSFFFNTILFSEVFFFIIFILFFFLMLSTKGLEFILLGKFLIYFLFLLGATVLTPPDLISQILFFFCFILLFEAFFFLLLLHKLYILLVR